MEPGLFVTFFNENEPRDRELLPVGPLDHVVLRHGPQLITGRTRAHHHDEGVGVERWFESELEFQRATGEEAGGMRRSYMRFTSRDGLYVRFVSYLDLHEQHRLTELGPYQTVVVRPREVEADGRVIASLAVADFPTWALTRNAGEDFAGAYKPDIALRAEGATYHPSIGPTPLANEPQPVRPAPPPPLVTAPVSRPEIALAAREEPAARPERERSEDTLRARIFDENRQRAGADAVGEPAAWTPYARAASGKSSRRTSRPGTAAPAEDGFSVGEALWRWRFAIIGVLLIAVVTYAAYIAIRSAAPAGVQYTTMNIGQRFSGTRWDWTVNSVERAPASGGVRAQGVYYIVNIAATNKATDGATLAPSDFTLVDANGADHAAASIASGVYQGQGNPSSPYQWPPSFPIGRPLTFSLLFDVDPGLPRGNALAIADAPNVRVKLE